MKRFFLVGLTLLLAIVAMLPLSACSKEDFSQAPQPPIGQTGNQEAQNMASMQREITEFIERRNKAMIDKDTATLSHMMADDLALIHITGVRQTKREWLDDIANGRMRYFNIVTRNLQITPIDETTATARYASVITANIYGAQGTWTLNISQKYIKTNGDWLWVNP